ncbi:ABC transporter substrate-binding protein [Bacillus sp. FJAT-45066]|uniref:ABC transporter substrate-binding protein n=1 Tax=Bacillus sp. FJAT-45066 TaxID=2011010 RepID=UPI000BB8FD2C|nr:ABC transporter substrate-binding protein [Bacillus sp. FJAT-45066]
MNERYLSLRAHLKHYSNEVDYEFKLEEADQIWFCSRKNTKRILRQLKQANLLAYQPGRGRGNSSKLTYPISFQHEIERYIEKCVNDEQLDLIAQILRLPIPKSWVANSSKEIRELLGFQRDDSDSRDVLHTFKARDITTLDPLKVSISLETHLIEYLGDTLVRYDSEKDCFVPHLAHHFHADETNTVWTFYLRKSVSFHNGEYVTSKDVAYTIDRMKTSSPSYSWLARNIVKVECPHQHKVIMHLDRPNGFFLRYLSAINFCILPANVEFNEYEWIGTGPFRLKERTAHKLVLEAHDTYFKERPLIDEIHFYQVTKDAAKTVYLSGDENATNITPSNHKINDAGIRLLAYNLKRQNIIQQPSFRKAIYHLFDVQKMAQELSMEIKEASSFEIERSKPPNKDAKRIIGLLEEAGYHGEPIHLYHFDNYYAVLEAEWMKKEAKTYGISIHLHPISFWDFSDEGMEDNIDILIMGLALSFDKHLAFSYAFKNKALLFNRMFHPDVEAFIYKKLEDFEFESEKHERDKLMQEMEQYLQKEFALFFLYHPIVTRALDPLIQDVESHSFGHLDFTKLWLPS